MIGKLRSEAGLKLFIIITGLTSAIGVLFPVRMVAVLFLMFWIAVLFVKYPQRYARRAYVLLLIFCVLHVVTTLYNYKTFTMYNLIELSTMVLLFFGLMYCNRADGGVRERFVVMRIYNAVAAPIAVLDLLMYLFYIRGSYLLNGNEERFGMFEGRLWGLFNANMTAFLAFIAMMFSYLLWRRGHHKRWNTVHFILQLHVFLLAQSRSMWAVFVVVVCVVIGLTAKTRKKRLYRMVIGIPCIVLFYLVSQLYISYVTIQPARLLYHLRTSHHGVKHSAADSRRSKPVNQEAERKVKEDFTISPGHEGITDFSLHFDEDTGEQETMKGDEPEAKRHVPSNSVTQGRAELWKDSLLIVERSPLIGNGLYELRVTPENYFSEHWVTIVRLFGLHNTYMMILVVGGIFSLAVFLAFVAETVYRFLKYILTVPGETEIKVLMAFCLAMFGEEMLESRILYIFNYSSIIFWLLMGYCWQAVYRQHKQS